MIQQTFHSYFMPDNLSIFQIDNKPELYANKSLFSDIAQNLAKENYIKFEGFGPAIKVNDHFVGKSPTWQHYLASVEPLFKDLVEYEVLKSDVTVLRQFWDDEIKNIQLSHGSLVHGDFAMSAVFVRGRELCGVIDYGDALIGDPLMDIAYFRFKEITKPYGTKTYQLLLTNYLRTLGVSPNDNLERRIIFYMIYWGLVRITRCPDISLRIKFAEKLHLVAQKLF